MNYRRIYLENPEYIEFLKKKIQKKQFISGKAKVSNVESLEIIIKVTESHQP